MGHTVWSQRIVIDTLLGELKSFGKALRKEDREIFEDVLKRSLKHIGSISYASSLHAWAFVLIAIIIEQEKMIRDVADRCVQKREQDCGVDKDR